MIAAALIPAAGRGQRMGLNVEKQFLHLGGKPLLAHTLARFEATPGIDRIIVIVPPGREAFCAREIVEASLKIAGDVCIYTNTNVKVETL